ncbi:MULTISPECIES: 30S ribosomal protein S6 [Micrococcus]|uniref:Small ribosomal subunit protein bS6 n=1 Tax=Micrococcus terreus TaxID=574650 RepID=A0A1I7MRG4_9MICC|nr:30S ribosomal protein S6 [Micrococcus terreus]MCT2088474.1 30S ribosomal protein S6 [Micrococcus terreus]MDK7700107.1 30S ribosomal protein S6 [Micrococcus terreus]WOO97034.1 30S ribosomal protein S6 [Micrococcus terreus]SFV24506.1 small subunit ribosomal protein S6 [Micrococcus terreus]
MRAYELMVLIDPDVDERTVEPTVKKYLEVVTKDGGSVENVDIWGRRRLAYEIQKKAEAIYVVVNFTSTPETSKELDRQLSLNETILRTKIIRPEEQKISAAAAE